MKILSQLVKIQLKGLFFNSSCNSKTKAIVMTFLYIYAIGYFVFIFGLFFNMIVSPFHMLNIDWLYFALMGLLIFLITFVGSVFMTYQVLYDSKDNNLLLSMPIPSTYILLSRFITLYIFNLIMGMAVAIPALYIFIKNISLTSFSLFAFICVIMTLPLFVLVLSSVLSYFLGRVLLKTKNKNLVTLLLSIGFMMLYFTVIGNIQEYMLELIANGEMLADVIKKTLFPLYHMAISISDKSIGSLCIYLLCSIIPFICVFKVLSHNFIKFALSKPTEKKEIYKVKRQSSQSLYVTLVKRELKHISSNANVFLNGCIGIIFCVMGAIALFFYKDDINSMLVIFENPFPYICFMIAFMSTMTIMSASLISLEGNSFWILKVIPVTSKQILLSKLLVQYVLTIPSAIIFSISVMINLKLTFLQWIIIVITIIIFNVFVGLFGLIANILLPNFNWRNEVVCVKQSMSTLVGMLGSIVVVSLLGVLYTYIDHIVNIDIYMYIVLLGVFIIDVVLYGVVMNWGVKKFEKISA